MPSRSRKQPQPVVSRPLFHEVLGKDLSQKLLACSHSSLYLSDTSKTLYLDHGDQSLRCPGKPGVSDVEIAVDCGLALEKSLSETAVAEKKKRPRTNYELDDLNALHSIERLVGQYGRMTHMGVRDHSYHFYLNYARNGVLSYRLLNKVAVISGDPICPVSQYTALLQEFRQCCKAHRWQYAITGGSADMLAVAKSLGWTSVHYAKERCLNLQENPVLLGAEGKRIRTQCKQLMNNGTQLDVYCPMYGRNAQLEQEIADLYETWRAERNSARSVQAYVTIFDLFALHRLMVFVYSTNEQGQVTGFSALRKLKDGYHIDPLIARADAPRGIVDLLLVASMAFLREAGIERLALGVEPLDELGEITRMSRPLEHLTRKSHQIVSAELTLGGKKNFNDRFKPDASLEEQIYILYPNSPSMRQSLAMAHFANIKVHAALKQKYAREFKVKRQWLLRAAEQMTGKPGGGVAVGNGNG